MERLGFTASEEKSFENVDGWTDERQILACTISSPMSRAKKSEKETFYDVLTQEQGLVPLP